MYLVLVKYLALLLLFLNAKSWPFVWHGELLTCSCKANNRAPYQVAHPFCLAVKLWWPAIWGHIQAKRKGLKPYYWGLGLFTTKDRQDPEVQKLIQKDPYHGDRFMDHTKVVSKKKCHAYYDDCKQDFVVQFVKLLRFLVCT